MKRVVLVFVTVLLIVGTTSYVARPAEAFACGTCGDCLGGHVNPFGGGESERIHSHCVAVTGCPHPDCVVTLRSDAGDFERTLVEAEAGNPGAAEALLRHYPGTVVWNRERHALQLRAPCIGDAFVGHLPLTTAQTAYLEASR